MSILLSFLLQATSILAIQNNYLLSLVIVNSGLNV